MIKTSRNAYNESSWTKETEQQIRQGHTSRKCSVSVDPVQFELQNDPSCFVLKSEIQPEDRGSLCFKVVNGGSAIQFTFETTGPWTMVSIAIWGDKTHANYPIKYGAPNYQEFPISAQTGIGSTKYTAIRPLNDFIQVESDLNETIAAEIIAAVQIENLFDVKSPRISEQAWAHQNWLSMVNIDGVSHFFSRLELNLPNAVSSCSSPVEGPSTVPSSPVSSMSPSVSPSVVLSSAAPSTTPSIASSISSSTESSPEISSYSESNSTSHSPSSAPKPDRDPQLSLQSTLQAGRYNISPQDLYELDERGQLEPSKVIVGITFTIAYGNEDSEIIAPFRSAFDTAFSEFASDVISWKKATSSDEEEEDRTLANAPHLRQRRFLRGQNIKPYDRNLLVELDQHTAQVVHYNNPGNCSAQSLKDEEDVTCHDGVAHYTLILTDGEDIDEVCRYHLETTKTLLEEGLFEKLIQEHMANKDVNSLARLEQVSADFCRPADSAIISTSGVGSPQQETHQYDKNTSTAASGIWLCILITAVACLMLLNCILACLSCFHCRRHRSSKKQDLIKQIESGLTAH